MINQPEAPYTRHQLEHGGLGHLKKLLNFLETLQHGLVIANRLGHASSQAVSQCVIDVELTWRARGQESVVQAYQKLAIDPQNREKLNN